MSTRFDGKASQPVNPATPLPVPTNGLPVFAKSRVLSVLTATIVCSSRCQMRSSTLTSQESAQSVFIHF